MKKVLLALSVVAGTVCLGQSPTPAIEPTPIHPELRLDATEASQMLNLIKQRKQVQKAKTTGGVISKRLIGFADTLYTFYGGNALFGGLFQVPIYSDSTLKQEFTNATSFIDQHAVSMTYDPSSIVWGDDAFSEANDVTIDSVHIFGKYDSPITIPNPSGDSLIVEVTWASKLPASNLNDAFQGVFYVPNGNNPDTCFIENPLVDVTAAGGPWKLEGTNYLRTGIELTANDLASSTDPTPLYSIAINQLIPAGSLVGVSFRFKSAYSAMTSVGDTFFSTIDVENTKIPNFATRLASENVANGARYFCDPGGDNSTGELTTATLYQTNGNFRDGQFGGRVTGGYFLYLTVSGISTFNLDEGIPPTAVNIYPNPSNGMVNLDISQGGTYQLELLNITGQLVHSEKIAVSGTTKISRDFSHLNNGVYLVHLRGDSFEHTAKLTINR